MVYHVPQSGRVKDVKGPEVTNESLLDLEVNSMQPKLNRSLRAKLSLWSVVNFILAVLAAAVLAILGMLCSNGLEGEMIVVFVMFGMHLFSTLASAILSWGMESRHSTFGYNLLTILASGVILLSVLGIIGFVSMSNNPTADVVCERNAAIYMLAYGVSSIVIYSFCMIVFSFCFS